MLKSIVIVAALGSVAGLLVSEPILRMANADCAYGCKEDHDWIFATDSSTPTTLDCYRYVGAQAHVGLVDGPNGTKTPRPNGTNGRHRCPLEDCDEQCGPVVTAVFTEADYDLGEAGHGCVFNGTPQTQDCIL
jgi:hypothetical protein